MLSVIKVHYSGLSEDRSELQRIENYWCTENRNCTTHLGPIVVVATLGLGLGIDCTNVGLVVHYTPPSSFSRWRQETLRAARRYSARGLSFMFYSISDFYAIERRIYPTRLISLGCRRGAGTGSADITTKTSLSRALNIFRYLWNKGRKGRMVVLSGTESTALYSIAVDWHGFPRTACHLLSFKVKRATLEWISGKLTAQASSFPQLHLFSLKVTLLVPNSEARFHTKWDGLDLDCIPPETRSFYDRNEATLKSFVLRE